MACSECLCKSKATKNVALREKSDWKPKVGYGVAMGLAILEAKRFFLLVLEILVDWRVIRFSGGSRPVIFAFVDVFLGFPCALAASHAIRKSQAEGPCCSRVVRMLRYLLPALTVCIMLNLVTLISIGFCVSVKPETIVDIFNASMRLYVTSSADKYTVDEMQFKFQCCGHSAYTDWFLFDWQKTDYGPREDMALQERISDEEYRPRGVPFSCCSLGAISPCINLQMTDLDVETINNNGCARSLSVALIKIVVIGYIMTTILIVMQILLMFFMTRITCSHNRFTGDQQQRPELPEEPPVVVGHRDSTSLLLESAVSDWLDSAAGYSTDEDRDSSQTLRELRSIVRRSHSDSSHEPSSCSLCGSPFLPASSKPRKVINNDNNKRKCGAARIKPSTHVEHRLSKRRLAGKRTQ